MRYLSEVEHSDVIVIGAGLAGITAALELSKSGFQVLVLDRHPLPRHRVCGEYLSREVVPFLQDSGVYLEDAPFINTLVLGSVRGKSVSCKLPLGGIGISRHALDFRLYEAAKKSGARFIWEPADDVICDKGFFRVLCRGKAFQARQVLGAWGKRSQMDRVMHREFFRNSSPWMGIKMHYRASYPRDQVGLYAFRGGYGGLSVTETGAVNFCYLIHRERFREMPDLKSCTDKLLAEHPSLQEVLQPAEPLFGKAISISNISFEKKDMVCHHILMGGDAARLIHPLCGNGMAMAIASGRIQARLVARYLKGGFRDRAAMERAYVKAWDSEFSGRVRMGARLQRLLLSPGGMETGIRLAALAPGLLRTVIRKTHGVA